MRIIILLLLLPVIGSAQKGFFLRGDTLFYNDGEGIEKQLTRLVPSMTGQSGNVLSNNGTAYTWVTPSAGDWSAITGKPSTFTPASHSHTTADITNYKGYTINVQALTSSPTDAQTVYFGMLPKAPVTAAATSKVYIREAGTITAANIYCYSGTAGTAESWSLYIRVNNTTDYLIATLAASASERVFSNTSLSIAVTAGDYIEIKGVQPTWVTNPLTTIYGGYILIK